MEIEKMSYQNLKNKNPSANFGFLLVPAARPSVIAFGDDKKPCPISKIVCRLRRQAILLIVARPKGLADMLRRLTGGYENNAAFVSRLRLSAPLPFICSDDFVISANDGKGARRYTP